MTRALFYNVLDTNPVEAGVPQVKEALPEPATSSRAEDSASIEDGDGLAVMITWLHAHPEAVDPHLVPAALSVPKERREDTPEWHFEGRSSRVTSESCTVSVNGQPWHWA